MACNIAFLSENLVDNGILSLTTGTEDAQFPLSNIKNEATAIKFRSIENSVAIVVDMQQTRTIDSFALHGDANGTLGLTAASVKYSLTTDFSGSPVINIPLSAENLMGYQLEENSVSARYVELILTGTGSFVEVSNFYVGLRDEITNQNLSIGSFEYGFNDQSRSSLNKYGQRFIDKRNKIKNLGGDIEYCIKSEQEQLDNIFIRHGASLPIWMIVDRDSMGMTDGQYKLTIYGYFTATPQWSASGGQTYNTSVEVAQAG